MGCRRRCTRSGRPVWDAIKAINRRTWIECVGIFLVVYTLLFTTFFTNLGDPWNCLQGLGCSKGGLYSGSIGALRYWIEQHDVQRGGQPFYYYVLLIGLYEFVPFIFAIRRADDGLVPEVAVRLVPGLLVRRQLRDLLLGRREDAVAAAAHGDAAGAAGGALARRLDRARQPGGR